MKNTKTSNCPPVAIVGISSIFPGSETVGGFWKNILDKEDQIKEVPESHWLVDDYYDEDPKARDKTYGKTGGFIPEVSFDPMAFGMPPNALETTDTGQLLAMMVAKQVLDDAYKGQFSEADKSKISVILGTTGATELIIDMGGRMERPKWLKALREEGLDEDRVQAICDRISNEYVEWKESSFPGLLANVVAGRIAHRLDLGGTNFVTDAACASSLAALNIALNELYLGNSDVVITGGVDALNTIAMFMCFSKTPALSASGDCRPFSDSADGTILGEGVGMVAIKRLVDAERDGDQIYGVIKGLGNSSDGKGSSVYAPVPEGQAVCMQRAYESAGYGPETVELLEAHGTATKAGDAAEFKGLGHVFETESQKNYCALGSVKSNIGHTKASAGIAGLIKAVMALQHKTFPPTIKVEKPSQKLDVANSAFYLNTETRPWVRSESHPRRASISSFGFGGTNFHVTLEEYIPTEAKLSAKRKRTLSSELYLFSADNKSALSKPTFADNAPSSGTYEAAENRFRFAIAQSQALFSSEYKYRLAVVAKDQDDLNTKLSLAFERINENPETSFSLPNGISYGVGTKPEKIGFLFSGQGSQYVNMGADIAMNFESAIRPWDAHAESDIWGDDEQLHQVVFPYPVFSDDEKKNQTATLKSTQWAQPAIASVSLSQLEIMRALGLKADAVAGHSLGELTALHAAGVFDETTLLAVSRKRGLLMNEAAKTPGAMLAVMGKAGDVQTLLNESNSDVTIANYNAPSQTIVAGSEEQISGFSNVLSEKGVRFTALPVATAFHSEIVAPSVSPFKCFLDNQEFSKAKMSVYSNLNGKAYPKKTVDIKKQLGEQIANPVRFIDQIESMYAQGIRTFVEIGPDAVLTGLTKSCLKGREFTALSLDKKGKNGIEQLWQTLGSLAAQGYALDIETLMQDFEQPIDPASLIAPKLSVTISGANYGKKYPPVGGSSALPGPNAEDIKLEQLRVQLQQESEIKMKEELAKQLEIQKQAYAASAPTNTPAAAHHSSINQETATQSLGIAQTSQNALFGDWQNTFREVQQETLKAQMAFQTMMAESHQSFLKTAEIAMMQSMSSATAPQSTIPQTMTSAVQPAFSPPSNVPAPQVQVAEPLPVINQEKIASAPAPVPAQSETKIVAPAPVIAAVSTLSVSAPALDLNALMLDVVAEKTGYPAEMLNLGMHLENDLGIDSIKRVEILAAVMDAAPEIPEFDSTEMTKLATLKEIVDFMDEQMPDVVPAQVRSTATSEISASPEPASAESALDLNALMLDVVAEKTGYPAEMLNLGMHLENDLGIDSIKRVEILAAVMDAAPQIPEFDSTEMTKLSTLKEIVDFMDEQMPTSALSQSVTASQSQPIESIPAGPALDLNALMLNVVADKTGYPSEMLNLDMHLENDLGIDSIKRVEILAAVMDEAPEIPEFDSTEMSKLSTLKEIVDFMDAQMPSAQVSSSQSVITETASVSGVDSIELKRLMLEVVAEKTGYPSEMLNLDMHLENDLGIDSIKRVEILAGVMDQVPDLPELDNTEMAKLSTLQEIVGFIDQAQSGASPNESPVKILEQTAIQELAALGSEKVDRFSLQWMDAPALDLTMQNLKPGATVLVTDDEKSLASALVIKFCERGYDAHVIGYLDDRLTLEAELLVFTGGLKRNQSIDDALEINKSAFNWAQKMALRLDDVGGTFVTLQDTGGQFLLASGEHQGELASEVNPYSTGLTGLCKTAALEWSNAYVKAIDIQRNDEDDILISERIFDEIVKGGFEKEVGLLADGSRGTLVSAPLVESSEAAGPSVRLSQGSVIIASGGARGVTAECLVELAKEIQPKIALLGRTELFDESSVTSGVQEEGELKKILLAEFQKNGEQVTPAALGKTVSTLLANREVTANIVRMESAGATVSYFVADIRNTDSVTSVLNEVRKQWGEIKGLVHGAGVIADKLIAEKTTEQFDAVFGTKIDGIRALLSATKEDNLEMICLFSSVAGRSGNKGQSDYSMANEVLNKVAAKEFVMRNSGDNKCQVKSINWGPWDSGMVSPALKKQFASMGVPLIPLKQGAEIFVDEVLRGTAEQVEVVVGAKPDGSLLSAADKPTRCLSFQVSEKEYGYLSGHQISGSPVVPFMLVADWITRACVSNWPNLKIAQIKDFRCLRGVVLEKFEQQGSQLELVMQEVSMVGESTNLSVAVSLLGVGGPHYSAEVILSNSSDISAEEVFKPFEGLAKLGLKEVYDGDVLFHQDEFRVIQSVNGVNDTCIESTLRSEEESSSLLPTLILDGGLQTALLWVWKQTSGGSLPLSINSIELFESDYTGDVSCQVSVSSSNKQKTTVDIRYFDYNDRCLAAIKGLDLLVHFNKEFPNTGSAVSTKESDEAMDAL